MNNCAHSGSMFMSTNGSVFVSVEVSDSLPRINTSSIFNMIMIFLLKICGYLPINFPCNPKSLNTKTEISVLSSACLTIHYLTGGAFC